MSAERAALIRIMWVSPWDSEAYKIAREALIDVVPDSDTAAAPPPKENFDA